MFLSKVLIYGASAGYTSFTDLFLRQDRCFQHVSRGFTYCKQGFHVVLFPAGDSCDSVDMMLDSNRLVTTIQYIHMCCIVKYYQVHTVYIHRDEYY